MGNRVNYTVVGLFVVILTAALIIIGLWLTNRQQSKAYNYYLVYMNESVSGLSVQSPVKYSGVQVGYVEDIQLNPKNPQQVRLQLKIENGTPITESTTATLTAQGITGLTYIGLKANTPDAPPLTKTEGEPYPVIKSTPSFLVQIDTVLRDASQKISNASVAVGSTMKQSEEVLQSFSQQTLPNTVNLINNLNSVLIQLQDLTSQLSRNPAVLIRGKQPPPPGPGE